MVWYGHKNSGLVRGGQRLEYNSRLFPTFLGEEGILFLPSPRHLTTHCPKLARGGQRLEYNSRVFSTFLGGVEILLPPPPLTV